MLRTLSCVQLVSGGDIAYCGASIVGHRSDARVSAGIRQVREGRQVYGPLAIEDNLALGAYIRPKSELTEDLAEDWEQACALFSILKEKQPAAGRHAVRRPTAAAGDGARPDGSPEAAAALRAEHGPGTAADRGDLPRRQDAEGPGHHLLLVEQNAHAALSIVDIGYVLETGTVGLSGPGHELLANEQVKAAYLGM